MQHYLYTIIYKDQHALSLQGGMTGTNTMKSGAYLVALYLIVQSKLDVGCAIRRRPRYSMYDAHNKFDVAGVLYIVACV